MAQRPQLILRPKREGPVRGKHPWIFSGALQSIPEGLSHGDPVDVMGPDGTFLGQGYFNSYAQIAVRMWSYDQEEVVNHAFFFRRLKKALDLRSRLLPAQTNAFRLVNAECDLLPGLIIDVYAHVAVVQCHTPGIARYRNEIVATLREVLPHLTAIYERSDFRGKASDREHRESGPLWGETPDIVEMEENGLKFLVDVKEGQKTGFFLDQRDKRAALKKYVEGRTVLNCFSYSGGFSLYALAGGAAHVTSVDVSDKAMDLARQNVRINGFKEDRVTFAVADVKSYLPSVAPSQFDVIILDPPAFIKDRRKIDEGKHGYKKINDLALRVLPEDGILVSCSCSHHLTMNDFRMLLSETAGRAGRVMQLVETWTHGIDHPELIPYLEGNYLKTLFMRALQ
ncbi:23S rRNA (cytosine(1962)-C(5))-methyltransferase RlmI [Candidatus Gracilibacteria bacterium CG17_big_fil_post_rev_8_21_14_2_50_48_13]|nr:MAG: 23S rRNA (cytosine(1962)-C(5))-methyltransferase RlmI [Candidatus Gracilibacteria bacterium CG17_big_fil_post_rev_8_21_14_2_50_48_13]